MSDSSQQQPRSEAEVVAEYRQAHFSNRLTYRLKDLRRNILIGIANTAPGFWGSRVQNPIFVVGCARSGTTILETLLAHHRDIANWSEASVLWDPAGYYWSISQRETPPLWVDPEGFTTRWRRDNALRGQEIRAAFGLFQALRGRPYLLNKNPENQFRIADILAIFPEARFVHIVRDGRAMVNSALSRMLRKVEKWPDFHRIAGVDYTRDDMAVKMSAFWLNAVQAVEAQDRRLNLKSQGKLLEVRYEDLCADRRATLQAICDLTGLRMDRFRPGTWNIPVESQNFKWRQSFEPQLVERMQAAMQPNLDKWGYL